jgi:hypothetical protein
MNRKHRHQAHVIYKAICGAFFVLLPSWDSATADDARAPSLPEIFDVLQGCWRGDGSALSKPVTAAIRIKPILLGTMFSFDVDSAANANSSDRYQAHLLFGGGVGQNTVWGFWSDSFGAGFTANGEGTASNDGFEVNYRYPDSVYINRWHIQRERLDWIVVSKSKDANEKPFASYRLKRTACSGGEAGRRA